MAIIELTTKSMVELVKAATNPLDSQETTCFHRQEMANSTELGAALLGEGDNGSLMVDDQQPWVTNGYL